MWRTHCRAIEAILDRGELGRTYNVGSGVELAIETMANTILEILGADPGLKTYVPDRPGHDTRYFLDSSRIRAELGWSPKVEWRSGIETTVNWYRENANWWTPLMAKLEVDEKAWV